MDQRLVNLAITLSAVGVIVSGVMIYRHEEPRTQTSSDIAGYCLQYGKFYQDGIAFKCGPAEHQGVF